MISSNEYLELKNLLIQQSSMLSYLIPDKTSVSHISNVTGKSRQTLTSFLKSNFLSNKDFWLESGKIYMSKNTALFLIRKYNAKQ